MDIGTELVTAGLPAHRCHHAIADHQGPNVASPAFGHKTLDEDVLASGLQRFDDRLGDLGIRGEDHPDSLCSLEQLDHDGSTADAVDRGQHVGPVAYERRGRDGNVVSGEDLNRPELVSRVRNAIGGSRRVHVHLLELANDGESKERDRCTDAGEDGVEIVEVTSAVLEIRDIAGEVDGETERVEDACLVASLGRSRDKSLGAVRARGSREDGQFHAGERYRRVDPTVLVMQRDRHDQACSLCPVSRYPQASSRRIHLEESHGQRTEVLHQRSMG